MSQTAVHNDDTVGPGREPALLASMRRIVRAAGAVILEHYAGDVEARAKADASPVTAADEAAERLIVPALETLLPGVPVIAEEAVAQGGMPALHGEQAPPRFWLVDPLDGTKEFIKRNGEFTVNIALVEDGRPTMGVVGIPALGLIYAGTVCSGGATVQEGDGPLRPIAARRPPPDGMVVMSSRSHGDSEALAAFLARYRVAEQQVAGSSLKFCRIAEGKADLYPRLGTTMEWDTAAAHAVLAAAGGEVVTMDGAPLTYGKPGFKNPHFVARGLPEPA